MEQFKRAQVLMLPTRNDSHISLINNRITTNKLEFNKKIRKSKFDGYLGYNHQHLYIISDDKIVERDWCVNEYNNIFQYIGGLLLSTDMKIIATTDTLLYSVIENYPKKSQRKIINLPQPSQQFIERYFDSYNKGNVITDVLVEYEDYDWDLLVSGNNTIHQRPKVNPKDNTITIKKLKDSWNREEVLSLIYNINRGVFQYEASFDLDKWIEENL